MSTTTSPSAVKFSVSDFAASLTGPDADLITLCDRLYTLRNAELALYAAEDEDDSETEEDDALQQIDSEWWAVAARIYDHDRPSTLAGATAMARAAVPHVAKDDAGTFAFTDIGEWLTVRVAEFLAGSRVGH